MELFSQRIKKQMYEAKQRYIDKKNSENEKINTLTQEQHDAIQKVCSFRHNFHKNSLSIAKNGVGYETNREFEAILEKNQESDLPKMKISLWDGEYFDIDDYSSEYDIAFELGELPEEDDLDDWRDDVISEAVEQVSLVNSQIESWLRDIDKKYGTEYCPTGWARMR